MTLALRSQRKRHRPMWDAIIDYMIANPNASNDDLCKHVGRAPSTISMIINSDLFRAHYAMRRQQFNFRHDGAIMDKTVRIAHAGLDAVLEVLEKRRDKIPLANLQSVTESALSRLGYGAQRPPEGATIVNVNNTQQTVVVPVSKQDLLEAQMAYRQVQRMKEVGQLIDGSAEGGGQSGVGRVHEIESLLPPSQEAAPVKSAEEEGDVAPPNLST